MSKDMNIPNPAKSPQRGRDSKDILTLVKGSMLGVGTLYLTTQSVIVTVIGTVVSIILLGVLLLLAR